MKRMLALILCCVMLLPVATGCKDENLNQTIELNDARIAADILEQYESKYTFTHAEGKATLSSLKILTEVKEGNFTKLSVSAVASNDYVDVDLTVAIEYKRENNYWRLHRMGFATVEAVPTTIPNRASLMNTLRSYIHATGSALAKKGAEFYNLMFDVDAVTWGLSFDKVTKTAQFWSSYKSENLSFTGYYDLTFGATGWVITAIKQDGKSQPVMYLQTIEMK